MTYSIRIEGTDVAFACERGQSVLDAALRAGVELPYSCRKGTCGSCAGAVAKGAVAGLNSGAVRNETCLPEQVLFCLCEAQEDLTIRPASWKRTDPAARKRFVAKVYSHQLAAPDISILRLRLPVGQRAKFQPGQYLQVLLDDGSTRCFSMANAPQESEVLTLHIRHVPGGSFTGKLTGIRQGDTLEVELPFGNVALAPDDARPIVFVAGGTGFAPVQSILGDMARRRVERDITLIWGAREPSGLYQPGVVEKWRKQWPRMRYVPALSHARADAVAGAFEGRADEALRHVCPDLAGHVVHCCGSPGMVSAVRVAALGSGLAPAAFHADAFVPGPAARPA
jgi:CDP-4-dehydro-6-deoxyglucose reductase/terephthalate 1,2-dioxygenase reductase component